MTAEERVPRVPRSWERHPPEDRQRALEREAEACRQRIARLRAQGASEVSLLRWLERLQACEAELARLRLRGVGFPRWREET